MPERELVQWIAAGKTTKQAATLMGMSPNAAQGCKQKIMKLLGVHTVSDLIRYAVREKLM